MKNFRSIVEDAIQQVMNTQMTKPNILTDDIKKQVLEAINKIDVNVKELPSYVNHGHPNQDFARFPEPDDEDWDEDEEFQAQIDEFLEYMNADGIAEYINIPQEKMNDAGYLKDLENAITAWLTLL